MRLNISPSISEKEVNKNFFNTTSEKDNSFKYYTIYKRKNLKEQLTHNRNTKNKIRKKEESTFKYLQSK